MKVLIVTFLLLINSLNGFSYILDDCVCGQMNPDIYASKISNRVVNGTVVYPHKYPWMISMQVFYNDQWIHICGGSIISDRTILSAVHCMEDFEKIPYRFLTAMDIITEPSSDQIYYAQDVIYHPLHKKINQFHLYDITMIVVDRPIKFTQFVSPICLPSPYDHKLFWNQIVKVAGWGSIDFIHPENPREIETLMETEVRLITMDECDSIGRKADFVNRSEDKSNILLCALGGHTGACAGDSGGPLFVNFDINYHVTLGVASFVVIECASGFPEMYATVSSPVTLNWINEVIKNAGGYVCRNPTMS